MTATSTGRSIMADQSLPEPQPGIASLPFEPDAFLVVSDLHLAAGRDPATGRYQPDENFYADSAFQSLLHSYQSVLESQPLVLVLNGDTFDFVRIGETPELEDDYREWALLLRELGAERPIEELRRIRQRERKYGLQSDDYKSVWKLDRIARGHPEFFEGLGWWISHGGRVAFIKGNHDIELYWPLVQRAIRHLVARHASPEAAEARIWFVQGGLRIGNVYLEHGHQFEGMTAVKGTPTLPSWPTQLRFPLGSFVNRYIINKLEHLDPFLDNVKPIDRMMRTVVQRHPLQLLAILWRGIPFLRRAFRHYWWKEWLAFAVYFGTLFVAVGTVALILAAFAVPDLVSGIPQALRPVFGVIGAAAPWIGGVFRDLMLRARHTVGEDRYAAGMYQRLARVSFDAAAEVIYGVLGHTHRPDVQELPPFSGTPVKYLNSGTWTALWDEDRPDRAGRVSYSVIEFQRTAGGDYQHRSMEWASVVGRLVPATLLAPRNRRTGGGMLTARELATVRAFSEVFIEGPVEVLTAEQVAANVDAHLARVRTNRVGSLRLGLFLIEYLLPLLHLRWRFSAQSAEIRRGIIARRLASGQGGPLLRSLAKIKTLFALGYYADERVQASLPFVPVARRPSNLPPYPPPAPIGLPPLELVAPRHGVATLEADLVVIGSGAGGAVVAGLAAASGRRVILIEEGRYFPSRMLSHRESVMSAMLYKESGLMSTVDLGMSILQGRALGGTTVINNHICFRFNDPQLTPTVDLLDQWGERHRVSIDRAELQQSFDRVLSAIRAEPIGDNIVGGNGSILLEGWRALRGGDGPPPEWMSGRFTKNFNPAAGRRCIGCGYCNFGCPYERKLSMLETYVTEAHRQGATILTECHAVKLEREGRRVTGVTVELADGRTLFVAAGKVVVSAGVIGSTVLLLKSGFRHRPVGTQVSFNAATPMFAHFGDRRINGSDGDQMATFIDGGEFLLESSFNPPMSFSVALPGWFRAHFERMKDYDRFASAGVVVATEPTGRIKRSALLRRLLGPVAWRPGAAETERLRAGMTALAEVYFAAGARYVLPAALGDFPMAAEEFAPHHRPDRARIDRHVAALLARRGQLTLNSSHPQGGNPMSDDPDRGVVDSGLKVHGTDNLFVCDASVFPSSVRVNPQLGIMALADYGWHRSIGKS